MKVALINPKNSGGNRSGSIISNLQRSSLMKYINFIEDDSELVPALSLLQIAALLPKKWDITYIDEDMVETYEKSWIDEKWDMVLITSMINQATRAYELANYFKKRNIKTIGGGFHFSSLPHEATLHFDHVIMGEGEKPFLEFLKDLKNNCTKKIYSAKTIFPMDKLKIPRYDLIKYPDRYNMFPVLATRGCPYNCEFCSVVKLYGHKFRAKPVENVVRDIEEIKKYVKRPFISFTDENLLINKKYGKNLLKALIPLKISFECHTDLTVGNDKELVDLLAKSGCRRLQIGFESIEDENLKNIGPFKSKLSSNYKLLLDNIQRAGIRVMGMFIVGLDGDSNESLKRLEEFVINSNFHQVDFSILTPIPGTAIYEKLSSENRITTNKWSDYNWQKVTYTPKNLTPKEIENWVNKLLIIFYSSENIKKRKKYFKKLLLENSEFK